MVRQRTFLQGLFFAKFFIYGIDKYPIRVYSAYCKDTPLGYCGRRYLYG